MVRVRIIGIRVSGYGYVLLLLFEVRVGSLKRNLC